MKRRTRKISLGGGRSATYQYRHRKPGQGAGRVVGGLGPELFTGFVSMSVGWTDEGDNTYSCDGSNVETSALSESGIFISGNEHRTVIEIIEYTSGLLKIWMLSTSNATITASSLGVYEEQGVANGSTFRIDSTGASPFVGKVKVHSIKEVL